MESRAGARSNRLFPHPFLFLPGRHSVIRPALDVGLEPVQLTPRTSSWPCTHIFEQLISTFGSDSGRVASRETRAITCSVNGSVTFSHYICSLSGYGSGRAKPHVLYFHAQTAGSQRGHLVCAQLSSSSQQKIFTLRGVLFSESFQEGGKSILQNNRKWRVS